MDKNSLLGLFLIGLVLFGFTWYNSSQYEKAQEQKKNMIDSLSAISVADNASVQAQDKLPIVSNEATADIDSTESSELKIFPERYDTLQNEFITLVFSSNGARVVNAQLKKYERLYQPHYGELLTLFDQDGSNFDISFYLQQKLVKSSEQSFEVAEKTDTSLSYRFYIDSTHFLSYNYSIGDRYMVKYKADFSGIKDYMPKNQRDLLLTWDVKAPQQEKGFKNENNYTTIAYKYPGTEGIEELNPSTEFEEENEVAKIQWLAFKQQFFSSIIISDFNFQGGKFSYRTYNPKDDFIKDYHAELNLPYNPDTKEYGFRFYFGPNKYSEMNVYNDIELQKVIPLGGWIVGWISRLVVIPTFDFLNKYILNYGLIILILTVLIKLVISPLTYKSYMSMAKMRVLKPELDAIAQKYPKQEDAMKKQQAVMGLYKSAGVNPMGGCLPMLIQFPILWAMFRFFPSAIELRGESFLWSNDLSSYDSIWNFPGGFSIPWYGDHISLFTLLMAGSLFLSSKLNMSNQPQNNNMPGMNFMMLYLMPIMLLIWFNDYSSGLTYYYLLSNLFTLGQTYAFRFLINDTKLHAQIEANKRKPQKKSKWAERLEKMQKQAEEQQRRNNQRLR